jgi:hypothetical protein
MPPNKENKPMMSMSPYRSRLPAAIRGDFLLIVLLVALDVGARLAPHAPNFTPVAATALFAASVLRVRAMALLVPFAAMALSDLMLGFYDWRVMSVVYVAIALPALAGLLPHRVRAPGIVAIMLSSSLTFFATTNFAVWAFSGMYAPDMGGLIKCYIAALPFLQNTIAGDAFWATALFGGYWLVQRIASQHANAAVASERKHQATRRA